MASSKDHHTLKKRCPRFSFNAFITAYSKTNLVTYFQTIHLITCFCSMKNNLICVFIIQIINRYSIGITIITINRQYATTRTTKKFFRCVYTDFIFLFSNWSKHLIHLHNFRFINHSFYKYHIITANICLSIIYHTA